MTPRQYAEQVKQYAGYLCGLYELVKTSTDPNGDLKVLVQGALSSGVVTFPASVTADQIAAFLTTAGAVLSRLIPAA
jgi:hypothetical protein